MFFAQCPAQFVIQDVDSGGVGFVRSRLFAQALPFCTRIIFHACFGIKKGYG